MKTNAVVTNIRYFDITRDHIKKGQNKHHRLCPIAIAMGNRPGELPYPAGVSGDSVELHHQYFQTAPPLKEWINRFDNEESAEPIRIALYTRKGLQNYADIATDE